MKMKLPCNENAEIALLGILAAKQELAAECGDHLFHIPAHQLVFQAIKNLCDNGIKIDTLDFIAIPAELERMGKLEAVGGYAGVNDCVKMNLGSAAFSYYRDQLERVAAYRAFITESKSAINEAYQMTTPLEELVTRVQSKSEIRSMSLPKISDQCAALIDEYENDNPKERFSTGMVKLDELLGGGVERKEMLVVAGKTSRGKSLLLGQGAMASALADIGKSVAVFTLEMPGTAILSRFVSQKAGYELLPKPERQRRNYSAHQMNAIVESIQQISKSRMVIFDNLCKLEDILRAASIVKRKQGLDVLVVDYLQRVDCEATSREQEVAKIAKSLKNFGLTNDCAVLTASQLNDDGQVRESRTIGHESDILLQIFDEGDETEIKVIKHRRGQSGTGLKVTRRGELGRFDPVF